MKFKKAIPVSEVRAIKPIKNYRDRKFNTILYMTYILTFPDGDVWMKQTQMVNDLAWNLTQMCAEKKTSEWKSRAMALFHKNECWWKDNMGVEHLILIEDKPRSRFELSKYQWGVSKDGFAKIENGLTGEQLEERK